MLFLYLMEVKGIYIPRLIMKRQRGKLDLTGKRFGRLVAIRGGTTYGSMWYCECDCGKKLEIKAQSLVLNNTKSCGCLQKELQKSRWKSLVGQTFGRLIVLEQVVPPSSVKRKERYWKCQCKCGKVTVVKTDNLNNGNTGSCGCLGFENLNGIPYLQRNPELDQFRRILGSIKVGKRFKCELTLVDLKERWDLQKGICPYTGVQLVIPGWYTNLRTLERASVDRIDSTRDYVRDNIQFVSIIANYAKNISTDLEMIKFCKQIALHWKDQL